MKSKALIRNISPLFLSIFFFVTTVSPVAAQTSAWRGVCVSRNDPDVATIQGLQCLLANVLSSFLTIVGIAAFLMLVVSSLRILMAGGNTQAMDKAKTAITQAVIGLVLAVSAFVILNLIAEFTGVDTILNFSIPGSD